MNASHKLHKKNTQKNNEEVQEHRSRGSFHEIYP